MQVGTKRRDISELEGLLDLCIWVQNYDRPIVPSKRTLFLALKSKLNLKVVDRASSSTISTASTRKDDSLKEASDVQFLDERPFRERRTRAKVRSSSTALFRKSIQRSLRSRALCSIYPISAFSRIQETLIDASYRNNGIYDYNCGSSEECESSEDFKPDLENEGSKQEVSHSVTPERRLTDKLELSETEYDDDKCHRFSKEIDPRSLNYLLAYLESAIMSRIQSGEFKDSGNYFKYGGNFCFLTLWNKVEELTVQNIGDVNEEIAIWQQLRDILLLTGMSLKYPTWSGEQLINIITRIIPKRMLNEVIEVKRVKGTEKYHDPNFGKFSEGDTGFLDFYNTFIENPKAIFDLLTVSKLIQDNLSNRVKQLKNHLLESPKVEESEFEPEVEFESNNEQLSTEEESFLDIISGYSTCGEYEFDEDGFASFFETDLGLHSDNGDEIFRERIDQIDSLGSIVDLDDMGRIGNRGVVNEVYSERMMRFKNGAQLSGEFVEFNAVGSMQKIAESVLNLGISRKRIQDLICEMENKHSSFYLYNAEKEVIIELCKIIDDCIDHSSSLLKHCQKNKVFRRKISFGSLNLLLWFLAFTLFTVFLFANRQDSLISEYIHNFRESQSLHFARLGEQSPENYSLKDRKDSKLFDSQMIKASDCVLLRQEGSSIPSSDICSKIGDITVIDKCFTNLNR
ncbi:hypothetical protein HWI79_1592 [Cryptosporidium felis]|nr:hypothetical protein HWI79_1592 [Cryptosporidium felis]